MVAALPNLDELEDQVASDGDRLSGTRPATGYPRAEVRFEGVAFRYPGTERDVFDGLDLTLAAGTSNAIVGANGVGKTTLVKLLCRLHDATGGRILVDGVPLTEFDAAPWQRNTSVVFQDFNRYPLSVADNVTLGAAGYADDRDAGAASPNGSGWRRSSTTSRTGGPPSSPATTAASTSLAASGSASRWPVPCSPWSMAPGSSCSTSRRPRSTCVVNRSSTSGSWS